MNLIPSSERATSAPSHAEIELRAHQLWCQQGCPQGHDVDNWLEAERQLRDEATGLRQTAPAQTDMPRSEDVAGLSAVGSDSPHAAMAARAPLATAVEKALVPPVRPASRSSKTNIEF